jgi:coatomer protein complex subunit gamma
MEHAAVSVDLDSDLFEIIGVIPADTISYGNTSNCFCLLRRASHQILPVTLSCQLNFLAIEVDPDTNETLSNGYQEEYPLEDLTIAPSDLMTRTSVADFKEEWNRSLSGNEVKQKFMMQYDDVGKAATELIDTLGMTPCDSTQEVRNRTKHMLHLSGIFIGGHKVLARADFLLQKDGVVVKIAVRSDDKSISQSLVDCIG